MTPKEDVECRYRDQTGKALKGATPAEVAEVLNRPENKEMRTLFREAVEDATKEKDACAGMSQLFRLMEE